MRYHLRGILNRTEGVWGCRPLHDYQDVIPVEMRVVVSIVRTHRVCMSNNRRVEKVGRLFLVDQRVYLGEGSN